MRLSGIVAMSTNRVIGKNNALPWHLPADLKHFKEITWGHPIIMGHRTHQSIGRALPGRRNIILTRDPALQLAGCHIAHSTEAALLAIADAEDAFVIGGAAIYQAFLHQMTRLFITQIHKTIDGDTYFPELPSSEWQEQTRVDHLTNQENEIAYSFITLERIKRAVELY